MHRKLDFATKKKIVIGVLAFLVLTLLCLLTNLFPFYKSFLIGLLGLAVYPAIIVAGVFCVIYISNRVVLFDRKSLTICIIILSLFLAILQLALTSNIDFSSFGAYIGGCYTSMTTPGGVLFGLIVYPFKYLLHDIGAYVVFAIAVIVMITYAIDSYYDKLRSGNKSRNAKIERATNDKMSDMTQGNQQRSESISAQKVAENNNFTQTSNAVQNANENEKYIQNGNAGQAFSQNKMQSVQSDKIINSERKDNFENSVGQQNFKTEYDKKAEALKVLYPDKYDTSREEKEKKTTNTLNPNYLKNSLSKYVEKDEKKDYSGYIPPKVGYTYLNDNVVNLNATKYYDGIISGDAYKKETKQETKSVEAPKANEVLGNMRREDAIKREYTEKRLGDGLIMVDVKKQDIPNETEQLERFENKESEQVAPQITSEDLQRGNAFVASETEYKQTNEMPSYNAIQAVAEEKEFESVEQTTLQNEKVQEMVVDDSFEQSETIGTTEIEQPCEERIKPLLQVTEEDGEISLPQDAKPHTEAPKLEVVEENEAERRFTILPNSDTLAINKDIKEDGVEDTIEENQEDVISDEILQIENIETSITDEIPLSGNKIINEVERASTYETESDADKAQDFEEVARCESETNNEEKEVQAESEEAEDGEVMEEETEQEMEEDEQEDEEQGLPEEIMRALREKKNKEKEQEQKNEAEDNYIPERPYTHPPVDLLTVESTDMSEIVENTEEKSVILERKLAEFKVPAKVQNVVVGPVFTRYELVMPEGVSVKKIAGYDNDIAMALASKGKIRLQLPIPGKTAFGVEVPNDKRATVGFKEVFESAEFYNNKKPLSFVLGKDISGKFMFCDLAKAPHLLISGSTGSGKSVCLNIILLSIIYKCSPEDVRLILVDPKQVEFKPFENLPHLIMPKNINSAEKALNAFDWAIKEMEKRYLQFAENSVKNLAEYNQLPFVVNREKPKMPYIVIVVDELADILLDSKKELEEKIAKIAAKARAAGIHLILATQRPSTDVVTGTIKNNLPTRITFKLKSFNDSRTVLDEGGAETLLGNGDMLYAPPDQMEKIRLQAPYVSTEEINSIAEFVRENNEAHYDERIATKIMSSGTEDNGSVAGVKDATEDEMFLPAVRLIIARQTASATAIQTGLGIGWARASRLSTCLEDMGFISKPDATGRRKVRITKEQYEELYGKFE